MHLSRPLIDKYTKDSLPAKDAQRLSQFIAWGPVVFQASRLMIKFGILDMIQDSENGLTRKEIVEKTSLSEYAVKCLLEASLSIGTILVDVETERYTISKTGWFLLNDNSTRINMDYNHYVNYEGMFHLEEALTKGIPAGLKHFGNWPTLYEALSELPPDVQESWLAFDHYYSDTSFPEALKIVFDENNIRTLFDVGGNTGKWAIKCVEYNPDVRVTVLDLPQQIGMMKDNIKGVPGADRIAGYGINLLDESADFPSIQDGPDAIWMSQFLDCFGMDEIVSILKRAKKTMTSKSRLFIMETLWDRQRYEPAAFCLTMTSLYFSDIANGNSKMYNTEDITACIQEAGLEIEQIYDHLGLGHSILKCRINNIK